jgi:hypothetical protein
LINDGNASGTPIDSISLGKKKKTVGRDKMNAEMISGSVLSLTAADGSK